MRLFIARHGQTAWNAESRLQGHSDIELDDVGIRQAEALARSLEGSGIRRILSSDLRRAVDTAERVSRVLNLPVETDKGLRERSFGTQEGMRVDEFHAWVAQQREATSSETQWIRPPGGESVEDLWLRIGQAAIRLTESDEDTLVVGHGGSNAQLLARLLNGTILTARAFRLGNAAVSELHRVPAGHFLLLRFNDVKHLDSVERLPEAVDVSSR